MNKIITKTLFTLVCISPVAQAKILSPSLITPQNNETAGLKQPLTFSWSAKNPTTILKYHLIISTSERFSDYDLGKGKCVNSNTCADFITKSTNYPMAATHPFLQKEGSYFWQVFAIGKTGDKSLIFQGSENTNTGKPTVRKQVNISQFAVAQKFVDIDNIIVEPKEAANGSDVNFNVVLTDELPNGQNVKIDYGDGWKTLRGSGLDYSYQHAFTVPTSIKDTPINFTVAIFDENDEQQRRLDDSLIILANAPDEPALTNVAPTLSFVSGTDSVVKNKAYTLKLKASDDDGNLERVEVNWGDGSANDSKAATNGATLTFSHTYKFTGIQPLVANAIDTLDASSEDFSKSITVTDTTKPVAPPVPVPSVSSINLSTNSITKGNTATFSTTLSAALPAGYSVKINYGNGLIKMNGSGTTFNLSAAPTSLGSGLYTVGIYDNSKNVLKSNQLTGNFEVVEPAPVVIVTPEPEPVATTSGDVETFVSGSKTFSYTKIANDGSELPKTAKLGTNPKDWACTKDNNTGLIWEVKTTDGGLRDSAKTYTWDESFNFPTAVNTQGLCGAKDWRLPTIQELGGLLVCSDGKYTTYGNQHGENANGGIDCTSWGSVTRPTINTTYFPDIKDNYWFWSSSPFAGSSNGAWVVNFSGGYSSGNGKGGYDVVRLVR